MNKPNKTFNDNLMKKSLKRFSDLILAGYSHESYLAVSEEMRRMSSRLSLPEVKALGELWRDSYTGSLNEKRLKALIDSILNV